MTNRVRVHNHYYGTAPTSPCPGCAPLSTWERFRHGRRPRWGRLFEIAWCLVVGGIFAVYVVAIVWMLASTSK